PDRTLRFVFFANEEAPYHHTDTMGSLRHARQSKADGESIVAMMSLEMLGYYTTEPGSQAYPPLLGWFYPDRGHFIGFVGNFSSRGIVKRAIGAFRDSVDFPSYGFAGPESVPGVGLSDHSSFWEVGYPALMVTDTAYNRNPHYHQPSDMPDTLDYGRFARVVDGLIGVVRRFSHHDR
ncbi:MAG: M28 family peptidase, partial [Bradymonadaceae bacterium]